VRLLADENIPRAAIAALAQQGHDISAIGEVERGANDRQIVARAEREGRILLTFDKDWATSPAVRVCRRPAESFCSDSRLAIRTMPLP
jgi:predicted nuclease of predicted toxin-antitoxin system